MLKYLDSLPAVPFDPQYLVRNSGILCRRIAKHLNQARTHNEAFTICEAVKRPAFNIRLKGFDELLVHSAEIVDVPCVAEKHFQAGIVRKVTNEYDHVFADTKTAREVPHLLLAVPGCNPCSVLQRAEAAEIEPATEVCPLKAVLFRYGIPCERPLSRPRQRSGSRERLPPALVVNELQSWRDLIEDKACSLKWREKASPDNAV